MPRSSLDLVSNLSVPATTMTSPYWAATMRPEILAPSGVYAMTGDSEVGSVCVESCWYPEKAVTVWHVKPLLAGVFAGSRCVADVGWLRIHEPQVKWISSAGLAYVSWSTLFSARAVGGQPVAAVKIRIPTTIKQRPMNARSRRGGHAW